MKEFFESLITGFSVVGIIFAFVYFLYIIGFFQVFAWLVLIVSFLVMCTVLGTLILDLID